MIQRFHDRDFVPSIFRIINLQHVALNARDVEITRGVSQTYTTYLRTNADTYGRDTRRTHCALSLATVRFIHSGKVNRERAQDRAFR